MTCKLLDKTGKTVLGAGKIPLLPFNVGPVAVANCAGEGEGPYEPAAGTPMLSGLLLPLVVPLEVPLLPLDVEDPFPAVEFGEDGVVTGELPPPLAHAAMIIAADKPAN